MGITAPADLPRPLARPPRPQGSSLAPCKQPRPDRSRCGHLQASRSSFSSLSAAAPGCPALFDPAAFPSILQLRDLPSPRCLASLSAFPPLCPTLQALPSAHPFLRSPHPSWPPHSTPNMSDQGAPKRRDAQFAEDVGRKITPRRVPPFASMTFEQKQAVDYIRTATRKNIWYYRDRLNVARGPCSLPVLRECWVQGIIDEHTLVWGQGLGDWLPVRNVRTLTAQIRTVEGAALPGSLQWLSFGLARPHTG